ncbi:MAG: Amidase [Rhodobacteraceae bacterium HLUCCA12]|nr:MAG: Amidase [Rhodobacteraceae bacterium HLUCCA12]
MKTALLALHYQNEVLHPEGRIALGVARDGDASGRVVTAARTLLDGARNAGIPVISVRIAFRPDHAEVICNAPIFRNVVAAGAMIEGTWGTEFVEGLEPEPGEFVVHHTRISAFTGSPLAEILKALEVGHLIIAGVATNSVVVTTAAHAVDLGWEITIAADACSCRDPRLHQATMDNLSLIGDVRSVDEVVAGLSSLRSQERPA